MLDISLASWYIPNYDVSKESFKLRVLRTFKSSSILSISF